MNIWHINDFALIEIANSNSVSCEKDIRDSIRTNFGAGWHVNCENSGRTKILYVYQEGLGKANNRTSVTLPIPWKSQNKLNIKNAINFLMPLVVKENHQLGEAANRWKAQL